ncbi:MAG TPA: DMT family transporter [Alphaproteobacteria bacterium]|jgi:drug/metabolite transporter (DMT)-like permease|nr:DMT family transporter [Alphaproteobacteria bacterium]
MSSRTTDRAARGHSAWIGIALLVGATLLFSTHTNLARLSYDYGVSTLTILAGRSVAALPLVGLWLLWKREPAFAPRRDLAILLVSGISFALQSLFYLNAIHFIPVSLAVLLFYLFPIMVVFIAWGLGHERLTPVRVLGALVAFAGLALALNVQGGGVRWLGVGLGAAAALSLAINVVGAARMMRTAPAMTVTFNMLLIAAVVYCALLAAAGGPVWPNAPAGWGVFAGVLITGPLAQMCFYAALTFTGGARASIIMNGEPITTTTLALILLGETLAPVQIAGAALVVGAIFGVALLDRPVRAA